MKGNRHKKKQQLVSNGWGWGGVVMEKRVTGDTYPMCDCDCEESKM